MGSVNLGVGQGYIFLQGAYKENIWVYWVDFTFVIEKENKVKLLRLEKRK